MDKSITRDKTVTRDKDITYQVTMNLAKNLLAQGAISEEEYDEFNTKMIRKYAPKTGDLFTDIHLK